MELYYSSIIFIFGTIFGSFYNVVGFRLPKNLSLIKPGSFCPKCHHELKWYELIPVLSFLIQGGKCRKCSEKVSFFYPATEILTGILFMLSYLLFGFTTEFVIALSISSFLMIVIVSDVNYLIIPDEVTIFFSILTLFITLYSYGLTSFIDSLVSGGMLFIIMYSVMILGNQIFKKESMGGGDIKLMFFVGLVLAIPEGILVIFLASLIALPISLIVLFLKKSHVIPFGPFILIATLAVYFFQLDAISLINF